LISAGEPNNLRVGQKAHLLHLNWHIHDAPFAEVEFRGIFPNRPISVEMYEFLTCGSRVL
jgi:hypothetical protein